MTKRTRSNFKERKKSISGRSEKMDTPQLPLQSPKRGLRRVWLTVIMSLFVLAITFGSNQFENQVTMINNSAAPMVVEQVRVQFLDAAKKESDPENTTVLLKNRKLSPKEETTVPFHRGQHRLEVTMVLNQGDPSQEIRMSRRFETTNGWGQRYTTSANEQTPRAFATTTPLRRVFEFIRKYLPKTMNWMD